MLNCNASIQSSSIPCQVIHTIRDTPPNPSGLLALSTDSSHCYLAYPGIHHNVDDAHDHAMMILHMTMLVVVITMFITSGHSHTGELQVFDCINLASRVSSLFSPHPSQPIPTHPISSYQSGQQGEFSFLAQSIPTISIHPNHLIFSI